MFKERKFNCAICGKSFVSVSGRAKVCGEKCRKELIREHQRKKNKRRTGTNPVLSELERKARENGMSYGQYVASGKRG